jgi:integrase
MRFYKELRKRLGKEVWCVDGYINGVRVRDSGFPTKREAEDAIASVRTRARNARYGLFSEGDPVTIAELVAERVRDFDETKKNDRRKRIVLEMFCDHFESLKLVRTLTTADLLDFKRARLRKSKLRPNSINRELEAITAMLRHAEQYFPDLADWKPPTAPYEPTSERGRERTISRDEAARLLATLRAPQRIREQMLGAHTRLCVADLFELALNCGMRIGECESIERDWLDVRERVLILPSHVTKTRRQRMVPLNTRALEILVARMMASKHRRLVFTNCKGDGPVGRTKIYKCLRREAKRAGVRYGREEEGGFTFHDARHTAATRMLHGGADLATVADVLGHSSKTMTMRYAHATLESKRRAVDALNTTE